jgi:hypothetical protein
MEYATVTATINCCEPANALIEIELSCQARLLPSNALLGLQGSFGEDDSHIREDGPGLGSIAGEAGESGAALVVGS